MKRVLRIYGLVTILLIAALPAFAQDAEQAQTLGAYHIVVPLRGTTVERVRKAISATAATGAISTSIPMWNYTVSSPLDGLSYSGTMVGSNPFFNGARTTRIPTMVVPLIVTLPDGTTFDPTVIDPCSPSATPVAQLLGSPIFQSSIYTINGINLGSGQYVDEFQRANFFGANVSITGDSYHTVLSPVTVLPAQTISIPALGGASYSLGGCGKLGVVDLSTFNSIVTGSVLSSLAAQGVGPGNFPLFVLHDVVMGNPGTSVSKNCCVVGYHGAQGFPVQTYAVADYDTTHLFAGAPDIAPTSHEVGEWMDDPLGWNPTPGWGHIGQVSGCQNNLEVGDPLTGWSYSQAGRTGVTMPNGLTYFPQQLAFFSWFYRQTPSLGAGGGYSNAGTLVSAQQVCR